MTPSSKISQVSASTIQPQTPIYHTTKSSLMKISLKTNRFTKALSKSPILFTKVKLPNINGLTPIGIEL